MDTEIKQLIANVMFFKGLSDAELESIQSITVERPYQRGQLVFSDGEEGLGFFLVVTGKVKVYKVSPEGKEKILHLLGPGEPIGQVTVFAGESFPANAEAIAASKLLFFPRKAFVDLIHERPSLALNMLAILSNHLREFTVQIENLSLKEVPSRLASYLLIFERQGKRHRYPHPEYLHGPVGQRDRYDSGNAFTNSHPNEREGPHPGQWPPY